VSQVSLETPIQLGSRQCILIADEVAEEPSTRDPVLLERGGRGQPSLWVSEKELQSIRQSYPDLPVYGVFQTLLRNRAIPFDAALYYLPTTRHAGVYLLCEDKRPKESGKYAGNRLPLDLGMSLTDGVQLTVELDSLTPPARAARTVEEMNRDRRRQRIRMAVRWSGYAAAVVAVAFIADSMSVQQHLDQEAKLEDLRAQRSDLQQQISSLEKERSASGRELGREALGRLVVLSHFRPSLSVGETDFTANEWKVTVGRPSRLPIDNIDWVASAEPQPDGGVVLSWESSDE